MQSKSRLRLRQLGHATLAVAMLVGVMAIVQVVETEPAAAALPPIETSNGHVTSDALPTVQINGVVYDQYVLGNTVYAVGQFTSARPAGSPAGTNETPRSNMLAYNLSTGELIPSFYPIFNGALSTVTASPDGSRLYVGGLFTNVSGSTKYSIVALNPVTGSVINTFTPILNYRVKDIVATDSTVYVGGEFAFAGSGLSATRSRLAAFSAADGQLLTWAPSANNAVQAMVMSPKGDRLFVGGAFTTINGQSSIGLAAIDPDTGAKLSWPVDSIVRNSGDGAAILTLTTDGVSIFGGGWAWGQTQGNLEGMFSANPDTGEINWINDCHGDTYSSAAVNGYVYTASHSHLCSNIGAFPQSEDWPQYMRHSLSTTTDARGTVGRDQASYFNFENYPAPSQAHWYPEWRVGTYTGASQATWSVAGNNNYVVYGGEFPIVNGVYQQGLVRFAVRGTSPAKDRPQLVAPTWTPEVVSDAAGRVRLTIPANYDRDNHELNYRIVRDGATVFETRKGSTYWDQPVISFIDTGLSPGQSHSYRVFVTDDDGNQSFSDIASVTVSGSGSPSAYADEVMKDGARIHWRLNSAASSSTEDSAGTENGVVGSNVSFNAAGAINGDTDRAATFSSSSSARVAAPTKGTIPNTFTIEAWVKTSSNAGGRIAGFGDRNTANSSAHDRMLYMANNGRIFFGINTKIEGTSPSRSSQTRTINSPAGFNNNQWHHVVATLGDNGMNLYVDGVLSASRADVTSGQLYYGYFRVGADSVGSWSSAPSTDYLASQLDEAALYYSELTPTQIARHYQLSGRTPAVKAAPADAYGNAVYSSAPFLYYRLNEASGTTAADSGIRGDNGVYAGSITRNQTGAVPGNTAARFNGTGSVYSSTSRRSPGDFSTELWFNSTTTTGGQLIGFGSSQTGNSATSDRMVYMRNDGRIAAVAGKSTIVSSNPLNDGQWHHVVTTQSDAGTKLYVDGVEAGSSSTKTGLGFIGYWRVGGDTTPADSTSSGFNGLIDEAAVYSRALSASEALAHFTSAGGVIPNVNPTANFTTGGSFLNLTVNGTTSSDTDGSIVSYAWNFGDGATATGPTASHTYAAAGTYTVTLTVTDDDGGTGDHSQILQINAPIPNVAPTASFTNVVSHMGVTVNGNGSTDSDGSIVSYAWNFGDGATATGPTASHTYSTAGTYTVTLTVTDDDGATDTETASVIATEPTGPVVHAADSFERTVSQGWETANVGGNWSIAGGFDRLFSVSDGVGVQQLNVPGRALASSLDSVSATNVTFSADLAFSKAATGGGIFSGIAVRKVGSTQYRFRIWTSTSGTELMIDRTAGGNTTVLSNTYVAGLIYAPGATWRLKLDATGTSPTTLTAKIWDLSQTEPALPQLTTTDSTAALQGPGGIGLDNFLSGSATNAPNNVIYDNLIAGTGAEVPTPNVAPTANFATSVSHLGLNVDGTGSTDSDGVIVSYEWDFGDGATATGSTASHTYGAAGSYTVSLTVTDNDGDTNTKTSTVIATEPTGPAVQAADSFERSVSQGWGSANVGGNWSIAGGFDRLFSVSDGVGVQQLNVPGRALASSLDSVSATNVVFSTDLAFSKAATGGGIFSGIAVRKVGSTQYRFRIWTSASGTELIIDRTSGGNTAILTNTYVAGLVYAPGATWRLKLEATGTGLTTLTAKIWDLSQTEPALPQLTATDSTAALQGPGGIGLDNFLSGSATNAPNNVIYDNMTVLSTDN